MRSLIFLCLTACLAAESELGHVREARVFQGDHGSIPYLLLRPETLESGKTYPVVLFLHGAGQRGDDNQSQWNAIWDPKKMVGLAAPAKAGERFILIAPQCPKDKQWVGEKWGKGSYTQKAITPELQLALAACAAVTKELPADPSRRYLTGLSMGGYGTWDTILRDPSPWAAAVPICGGGDPSKAGTISSLPLWIWHGDDDNVVPVSGSRDMVAALTAAGATPKYNEVTGVKHFSWRPAYATPELWTWLFEQKKPQKKP